MSNVDDILGGYSESHTGNTFDRKSWADNKIQERNKAYNLIEKTAKEIVQDDTKFKQYLNVQSRFYRYSAGNGLLITAQMPNATQIKDFESWKDSGIHIKRYVKGITILEPSDPQQKNDGSVAIYYNPKKMFDISQTNAKKSEKVNIYSERDLLKAFLNDCPAKVEVVDTLDGNSKIVEYRKSENKLYICRGLDPTIMLQDIARELARYRNGKYE